VSFIARLQSMPLGPRITIKPSDLARTTVVTSMHASRDAWITAVRVPVGEYGPAREHRFFLGKFHTDNLLTLPTHYQEVRVIDELRDRQYDAVEFLLPGAPLEQYLLMRSGMIWSIEDKSGAVVMGGVQAMAPELRFRFMRNWTFHGLENTGAGAQVIGGNDAPRSGRGEAEGQHGARKPEVAPSVISTPRPFDPSPVAADVVRDAHGRIVDLPPRTQIKLLP
jgi:hypothetical protein